MIRETTKQFQDIIARGYPHAVTYQNAQAVRRGSTRFKRRVGQTRERNFYLEMLLRHGKIKEVLFMVVIGHSAGIMAVERVIRALKPDWTDWEWLNTKTGKNKGIEIEIQKLSEETMVRFIRLT